MKTANARGVPTLLYFLLAAGCGVALAGERPMTVANEFITITQDTASHRLALSRHRAANPFLLDASVSSEAAAARVSRTTNPRFGAGRTLEIPAGDSRTDYVSVFPGIPFAFLQSRWRNDSGKDMTIRSVKPLDAALLPERPAAELLALGTAGLTPVDGHPGSYAFLAVANPESRAGVVAGWLSYDRGSGILFSSRDGDHARLSAQVDYGSLRIPAGASKPGDILVIGAFDDVRLGLEQWADLIARYYDIHLPPQPSGYCTWYSEQHGGASDETHVVKLAEFAARELAPFGLSFVQIDDKWQLGARRNGPAKCFHAHNPKGPYPHGMKPVAERIDALGLTPGIWFMPFAGDHEDPFYQDHLDWFVKRPDGGPYFARWGGTSLDMTHPGARDYLRQVVSQLSRDWGYRYFKMDGLWTGIACKLLYVNNGYKDDDLGDAIRHDPNQTPIEAYRSGFRLIREAAGDDVFFLGCCVSQNMRSFGASFGLVDAMRIGPDNGANSKGLTRGPWHGSNRYFLHRRVWYNDPDPVYVRSSLPLEQAQLICTWVAITGQLCVSSEWLPALPPERLDILKRAMPSHTLRPRPADLLETALPRLWLLTDGDGAARRDVVGVFNWDFGKPASIRYSLTRLGLAPAAGYVGFDYWNNRFISPFSDQLELELGPGSAVSLALRPVRPYPQVVSTSRHITQGIVDLSDETWDAADRALSGVSSLVANDPYELRVVVPTGKSWKLRDATLAADDSAAEIKQTARRQDGPRIRISWTSPVSRQVHWRLHFDPATIEAAPPAAVQGLRASDQWGNITLSWDAGPAEGYRINRDDGATFSTAAPRLTDASCEPDHEYQYRVQAVGWGGQLSPPATISTRTKGRPERPPLPPAPDTYLDDLKPKTVKTGWGQVGHHRSCQNRPLTLDGKQYKRGMGTHANSLLVYEVPGGATRFVAVVGIDDEMRSDPRASAVFEVYGDVKEMGEPPSLLARSPVLCDRSLRTWCFDLELPQRVRELRLVTTDADDGNACDHTDWVNAGFATGR